MRYSNADVRLGSINFLTKMNPLPDALAAYVADLRQRAELGGVPAEVALRLEEGTFRRQVVARAAELWPPDGWTYGQGFAWVLMRMAAGTPAEEITHIAYYGPVRGPEMALAAAPDGSRAREPVAQYELP